MENRKYFKHTIVQREALYEHSGSDCGVLEELEEELSFRSTQRAKKLFLNIFDGCQCVRALIAI